MLAGERRTTVVVGSKALSPISAVVGTVTLVREEQRWKAPSSMERRPAGRVTEVRESQQENALLPMQSVDGPVEVTPGENGGIGLGGAWPSLWKVVMVRLPLRLAFPW
ncbi:hypothetical protein EMIHUDRAFT_221871 [Emiliania huxleyi CCMP1516]|uniref:Uncharacterized protein n=2 Tax=Emiliania huxleyi TaxID=2903 RepID=A0A0D3HXI9_EMIH1|nr:hypothetical protein EMIHUDRAFT_221871 [Emiliania huxleyi CCMP1516]EOD03724.1 hypothetical protein EMIHUDRAFT_221871 [Emiliania huxleyi CCMP1516]|eukprot:XP_005756153.1 hypothetical protein EMIHUDRAFT_221871 [Emiliania huxleyi CCMP1516]